MDKFNGHLKRSRRCREACVSGSAGASAGSLTMSASHSTFNCTVMLSTPVGHAFRTWLRYSAFVERRLSWCVNASGFRTETGSFE